MGGSGRDAAPQVKKPFVQGLHPIPQHLTRSIYSTFSSTYHRIQNQSTLWGEGRSI